MGCKKMMNIATKDKIKNDFLITVGSVIKRKRKKKNITLKKLSGYLDISIATLSRMENGKLDMPATTLPLISSYCGFPVTDYVYDEKVRQATKNFEMLLKNTVGESEQSKEEDIEQTVSMIGSHLLAEGTDKTVEVLYVAGQFIRMVMEDDAKLACELSKNTMDYICSFDGFVQRLGRMNN